MDDDLIRAEYKEVINPRNINPRALSVNAQLHRIGLDVFLAATDYTEIVINKQKEIWTLSSKKGWERHVNEKVTFRELQSLINLTKVFNNPRELDKDYSLTLNLPDGQRMHFVAPPMAPENCIYLAIRMPSKQRFTLDSYVTAGYLTQQMHDFLVLAMKHRLNIVTVGETGSGKTTITKALVDLYPPERRIIVIEDVKELDLPYHSNTVSLSFSAEIPAHEAIRACFRFNPDHILLTEIRGEEAWDYLWAVNSGHAGTVTSVHAGSAEQAIYNLANLCKTNKSANNNSIEFLHSFVVGAIDVICVFVDKKMVEVWYEPQQKINAMQSKRPLLPHELRLLELKKEHETITKN